LYCTTEIAICPFDETTRAIMSDKHFTARVPPVTTRTYTAKVKVGPSIPDNLGRAAGLRV
jgi:hypothetical protein